MNVGFTGTREGMTDEQSDSVWRLLGMLYRQPIGEDQHHEFHHGDEAHADTEAAGIAQAIGYWTVAWPGPDPETRGSHASDVKKLPMEYLVRNRMISEVCDYLVACPSQPVMIVRSGTWATVRYARQAGRIIYIVQSNGQIDKETMGRKAGLPHRYLLQDIDLKKEKP